MSLNYKQKRTLMAYKLFFGHEYVPNSRQEDNTDLHIEAQKMCYLLKIHGINIGKFTYTWNFRGPYSPGLLVLLRGIDSDREAVHQFYASEDNKSYVDNIRSEIEKLRQALEIPKHDDECLKWIELLGSLTYISQTVFPGSDFDVVNERLTKEKKTYRDIQYNESAWRALETAGMLCN